MSDDDTPHDCPAEAKSLHALVSCHAARAPNSPAILAPGRPPLTYAALERHISQVAASLRSLGLCRDDRVALVLPDGPELAVALVAMSAAAPCAPLHPESRPQELDRLLADLNVRAVVAPAGSASAVVQVAGARGIRMIELDFRNDSPAGLFTLACRGDAEQGFADWGLASRPALELAGSDDDALLLHTTGTSARPKLVPLTHANLIAAADSIRRAVELTERDRCLNVMPLFHIHGLSAVLASLAAGGSVVCTPGFSADSFLEWLDAYRPTWYTAAPTIHLEVLRLAQARGGPASDGPLRFIRSASAAMPRRALVEMERVFDVPFIEAYGMTEAAPQIASNRLPPHPRKQGSVGQAAGPQVAIMDLAGGLLPVGQTGEIVVRGPNVTRGYQNNADANADAFVNGWFRTGDQGHLDQDGDLFVTGRLKEIVNRGGEKISPREIDDVLLEHPAVVRAAAFAAPHPTLGESLAAAVVLRAGARLTEGEIRQFVADRLTPAKVPQPILIVDEIPHGPTGKTWRVDLAERLGLAGHRATAGERRDDADRQPSETATRLTAILADVLGVARVGVHDNFFQLGGDSLSATRVQARLRHEFQIDVPMQGLFDRPTAAELEALVTERAFAGPDLSRAANTLAASAHSQGNSKLIPARKASGVCPLSFAQQRLWALDQVEPGNAAYHMQTALRLVGPARTAILEQALNEIVRRHEALRTVFPMVDGHAVQNVRPHERLWIPVVDLRHLLDADRAAEARRLARREAQAPFHLARGPLLRPLLLCLADEEHVLLLTMHHIVSDGWSTAVFERELAALYAAFASGQPSPLAELPIQYADFAAWQRETFRGAALQSSLAYWVGQLEHAPPLLALPTDRPRPTQPTYRGARHESVIARTLTDDLRALSRREDATLFMTMLAAFDTLLGRYAQSDDIVVGAPIAQRTRLQTEGLIGFFANTLALRISLAGDPSFRDLLRRARQVALDAYAHQDVPFEKIVEQLRPERQANVSLLFQVMFAFQNVPDAGHAVGGGFRLSADLVATRLPSDAGAAKFDLTLYLAQTPQGLEASWQYATDLFDAATIERMAEQFQTLLEAIVADPERPISRLPLLTDAQQSELHAQWKSVEADSESDRCFHHLFEDQAARTPGAIAVECGDERLTYEELNQRANQLARYLRQRGVGPESLVGVCLTRSVEMLVAILGVWKAGGAYVPLDPDYPAKRLALLIEDSQVGVLVTRQALRDRRAQLGAVIVCLDVDQDAINQQPNDNLSGGASADNLAYVMHTSGSTGSPKGVMITHGNLCHYAPAMVAALGITADDRCLHTASIGFSSSVRQFAVPLARGAAVVVATREAIQDPQSLFQLIRDRSVSVIDVVPTYWRSCLGVLSRLDPAARATLLDNRLRLILTASEPLSADLPGRWTDELGQTARQIHMYGQTETTGIVMVHPVMPNDGPLRRTVPIGRPIANTGACLLDAAGQPVPFGVPGELHIGGRGVGRGYLRQPSLTAERFVPHPFDDTPGARLYRTGDLARRLPNGDFEYLGRIDQQVKVRGCRVEPGEIEAVLARHPGVGQCAVVIRHDETRDARLTALIVRSTPAGPTTADDRASLAAALRVHLRCELPEQLVPSTFVELDQLPRGPGGKLDRQALAALAIDHDASMVPPPPDAPRQTVDGSVPSTDRERVLTGIWREMLGIEVVKPHDNFFEIGGDSILGIRMIDRANQAGLQLTARQLFQHPTIAGLARQAGGSAPATLGEHARLAPLVASPTAPPSVGPRADIGRADIGRADMGRADMGRDDMGHPRFRIECLRAYGREALERAGLRTEGAAIVTEVQLEASLRGQPTHHIGSIPRYARRIATGVINPTPTLRIERETAISALLDGDNGPGQWIGVAATELAIRKAKEHGVGVVGVRRSNHFGAAGHYAWLAAREGLIGLSTSNAGAWLAPTGGLTATFGNNPLGVAFPAGASHPIVLDISMSVAAKGKIGLLLAEGRPLPEGWIMDRQGRPSADPADLLAGLGVPLGGHKGYGLTLMLEALSGILTGAGFCLDHRRERMRQPGNPPDLGQFFLVINPELLMPIGEFTSRVERMIAEVKAGERAEHVRELLLPGELEMRSRADNLRRGVPVRPSVLAALRTYAQIAGLQTRLVPQPTLAAA
jgi:amino acid adenylation domain-containing protein